MLMPCKHTDCRRNVHKSASKAFISNETQNIVQPLDKLSVLETKMTKFFDYLTKYHSIR